MARTRASGPTPSAAGAIMIAMAAVTSTYPHGSTASSPVASGSAIGRDLSGCGRVARSVHAAQQPVPRQ